MSFPITYAVKHKNKCVLSDSRSGGIFTALSDYYLENNGIVYGCALTEQFQATHIRAINKEQRDLMRGSKYVQSKMGDTFKSVRKDLDEEKMVFFSGTPCQVAGLRKYLGRDYRNLFCVDILCHGVPSPAVWEKYLAWQEKRAGDKIVKVDFRNKKDFGWRAHYETLWFHNGRKVSSRVYTAMFYKHSILRPCCYVCPFKSIKRVGDISIADYWGVEKAAPKFDDDKGVSLVLVNTEKGAELFEKVKDTLIWERTRIEDSMQNALREAYHEPKEREKFWSDFRTLPFKCIAVKYGNNGFLPRMRENYRRYKKRIAVKQRNGTN